VGGGGKGYGSEKISGKLDLVAGGETHNCLSSSRKKKKAPKTMGNNKRETTVNTQEFYLACNPTWERESQSD